jgi:hypothetical protein
METEIKKEGRYGIYIVKIKLEREEGERVRE